MKKLLAALLVLCMLVPSALSLADETKAKTEHIITTAISADPVTLDIMINNVAPGTTVTNLLFSGMYKSDATGSQVIPNLAEGYTVSEDGLTYTFTMKDGIFFSDGTPMDANDVYYSYLHVLDPNTASTLTTNLWVIHNAKPYVTGEITDPAEVGIKLINDKTIAFTLDVPTPWFVSSCCGFPVVKKGIYEENATWWKDASTYVCSGPFVLESFNPLEIYRLRKNPYYPAAADMQVEGLDIVIIEAAETELTAYNNEEIDVSFNPNTDAINTYKDTD